MIVYAASKKGFIDDVIKNKIDQKIALLRKSGTRRFHIN